MDAPHAGDLSNLDKETIIWVLSLLNTPRDLASVASVCWSFRKYVIEGELWKKLCIKLFPELGKSFKYVSGGCITDDTPRALHGYNCYTNLEAQSATYSFLLQRLLKTPLQRTCIAEPLCASSTDNIPRESVAHTLYPEPAYHDANEYSYWSSQGEYSASVPETLTYRLVSDLCVVYDVKIQPFLAFYQGGHPIYSSATVQFRFGYAHNPKPVWSGLFKCLEQNGINATADDFVWTYESPVYPMEQAFTLQTFQLPKPILCVGGILQIEFQGRLQRQLSDFLYYICVSHVYVTGRPIWSFSLKSVDPNGQVVLNRSVEKICNPVIKQSSRNFVSFPARRDYNKLQLLRSQRDFEDDSSMHMLLLYLLDPKLLHQLVEE